MDEQKIVEMLAQVLQNQTEMKHEVQEVVGKLELRIENEVIEKIYGLYDDREVQNGAISSIQDTLNRMEAKLDVLQLETAHIRRVK